MKFPRRRFGYILHGAATSARETFQGEPPFEKFRTVFEGTRNLLGHCAKYPPKNFLYLSSGAVYDPQPGKRLKEGMPCTLPEIFDSKTAWKTSKIMSESLCRIYGQNFRFPVKVARCFSFYGPGLPENIHYAIGNFLNNVKKNKNLIIKGNGKSVRSYLHIKDTITWIFKILRENKKSMTLNLGSSKKRTILEVAKKIVFSSKDKPKIIIKHLPSKGYNSQIHYVPDTTKIHTLFKVKEKINVMQAFKSMLNMQ